MILQIAILVKLPVLVLVLCGLEFEDWSRHGNPLLGRKGCRRYLMKGLELGIEVCSKVLWLRRHVVL